MLRSLLVADPHALVEVGRITQDARGNFSYPLYERLRDEQRSLAFLITQSNTTMQGDVAGTLTPIRRSAVSCRATTFRPWAWRRRWGVCSSRTTTGWTQPRPLRPSCSYAWWQRGFGARPDAVGATISINRVPFVIVGVAPRGFEGLEADGRWIS